MRELVGARDVAGGIDVRVDRLQVFVDLDGTRLGGRDAEFLEPVARGVGDAADRAQQFVECNPDFAPVAFDDQNFLAVFDDHLFCLVIDQHVDAFGAESLHDDVGNFGVFAHQEPRQHFDLGHLRAEAREALREFAADRSAAQHHQALGQFAQRPYGVRRQRIDFPQSAESAG